MRSFIPKYVIQKFLDRERKDWRSYKDFKEDDLEKLVQELPVKPPIWKKLYPHQKRCFIIGAQTGKFGYFLDPGMGKTLLSLALVRYYMKLGKLKSALVLVPNKANKWEWALEIEKHTKLHYLILEGSTKEKLDSLSRNSDVPIVVETYMGFSRLCSIAVPNTKKKGANKLKLDEKIVKNLKHQFNGIILDESSLAKSKRSLTHRVCWRIGESAVLINELTGTPFGRDPMDLWAQIRLLDKGHTLGETLGLYRQALFTEKEKYWGGAEYHLKPGGKELINKYLAHCTINIEADESSLPEVSHSIFRAQLSKEATFYHDLAVKSFRSGFHGKDVKVMKNSLIRMCQLSSGFIGLKDDDTGEKAEHVFASNPKLDLLMAAVERIPSNHKIIIFHTFTVSGKEIAKRLAELGVKFVHVWGATKDHKEVREIYENDPECQCLILQNAAGSYGLNLQIARYGLHYERPLSTIQSKQGERRYVRQGSAVKRKFMFDYITNGTFDERILQFHKEGRDLFKAIIQGEEQLQQDVTCPGCLGML